MRMFVKPSAPSAPSGVSPLENLPISRPFTKILSDAAQAGTLPPEFGFSPAGDFDDDGSPTVSPFHNFGYDRMDRIEMAADLGVSRGVASIRSEPLPSAAPPAQVSENPQPATVTDVVD